MIPDSNPRPVAVPPENKPAEAAPAPERPVNEIFEEVIPGPNISSTRSEAVTENPSRLLTEIVEREPLFSLEGPAVRCCACSDTEMMIAMMKVIFDFIVLKFKWLVLENLTHIQQS